MAKQKRLPPQRKPPEQARNESGLAIRSAESLGRVIGTLHRQLDRTIHQITGRPVHRPKAANDDVSERSVRHPSTRPPRLTTAEPRPTRRVKAATKKTTRAAGASATSSAAKRAARPK